MTRSRLKPGENASVSAKVPLSCQAAGGSILVALRWRNAKTDHLHQCLQTIRLSVDGDPRSDLLGNAVWDITQEAALLSLHGRRHRHIHLLNRTRAMLPSVLHVDVQQRTGGVESKSNKASLTAPSRRLLKRKAVEQEVGLRHLMDTLLDFLPAPLRLSSRGKESITGAVVASTSRDLLICLSECESAKQHWLLTVFATTDRELLDIASWMTRKITSYHILFFQYFSGLCSVF